MYSFNSTENNRKKILSAARKLFFINGYNATTTRQISVNSQTNLGLIKYYYQSKANIGLTVYNDIYNSLSKWANWVNAQNSLAEYFLLSGAAEMKLAFTSREFARFYTQLFEESSAQDMFMESLRRLIPSLYIPKAKPINDDHLLFIQMCMFGTKRSMIRYVTPRAEQISDIYNFLLDGMQLTIELLNIENYEEIRSRCLSIIKDYTFLLAPDMSLEIIHN